MKWWCYFRRWWAFCIFSLAHRRNCFGIILDFWMHELSISINDKAQTNTCHIHICLFLLIYIQLRRQMSDWIIELNLFHVYWAFSSRWVKVFRQVYASMMISLSFGRKRFVFVSSIVAVSHCHPSGPQLNRRFLFAVCSMCVCAFIFIEYSNIVHSVDVVRW